MRFGAHVSAAGGLEHAPENAAALGCEVFQFFSRPPQGGKPNPLSSETIKLFRSTCEKHGFDEYYIHAPYFINLASGTTRIRHGSVSLIREELERGSALQATYLMVHLGSAKDVGDTEAMEMVVKGIKEILKGYKGSCKFLIEMSAGAGQVIGDTFEELAEILRQAQEDIAICFDTAHAFASGYDLRTEKEVKKTFDRFNKIVGLEHLAMSHCNDSKVELGGHKDRHEHIGEGHIGLEGFRAIVNEPRLKNINLVLETPWEGVAQDIENLKKLRSLKKQP